MSMKQRDTGIDLVRTIGILAIVAGHVWTAQEMIQSNEGLSKTVHVFIVSVQLRIGTHWVTFLLSKIDMRQW